MEMAASSSSSSSAATTTTASSSSSVIPPPKSKVHKRNRRQSGEEEEDQTMRECCRSSSSSSDTANAAKARTDAILSCSSVMSAGGAAKKPRPEDKKEQQQQLQQQQPQPESVSAANEDSDDDDYDDLLDDFAVPTDMDDYLDDEDVPDDGEDDISTTSTRTSVSTGSVGSNTPSLVGENLESFSLEVGGEGGKGKPPQAMVVGGPVVKSTEPPLRRSLFSHVPPSINFVHHNEVPETPLPPELRRALKWKLSSITPAVVKKVVTNTGFRLMRKSCACEWGGTWGKHMRSAAFKEAVGGEAPGKINHFPGTFNVGRKDRLWKNYQKLRCRFGKEEFGYLPRTFCLPGDAKMLRKVWEKRGVKAKWIVKPPAMARGTGIKVVNKWSQIPKSCPMIVQRYIARPHLINGTKYDLRIYVLMTSLAPLRLYLYDEGLVRFASTEYAADNDTLGDVFMHLTNYSINKNSASYCPNEDPEERKGHKWTLGSLWTHLAEAGVTAEQRADIWDRIRDMAVKTVISGEHAMQPLCRQNLGSHYCGYELFGFDFLLDADLRPWLIEVNISPSLHSSSPLDLDVKSPLATEVFNVVRYHVPNKIPPRAQRQILQKLGMEDLNAPLCYDPRIYTKDLSKADRAKQLRIADLVSSGGSGDSSSSLDGPDPDKYTDAILERLTPDDVRCLIRAEDELARLNHFQRIFPGAETHRYLRFFQPRPPRYHDLLLDAWERRYGDGGRAAGIDRLERLCQDKVHLRVPQPAASSSNPTAPSSKAASNSSSSSFSMSSASAATSSNSSCSSSCVTSKPPKSSSSDSGGGIVNVNMLKAPTGPSCIRQPVKSTSEARPCFEAPEKACCPSAPPSAVGKRPSFVARPSHMCKSSSSSSIAAVAKAASASASASASAATRPSSSSSSKSSSPEPMSVDNTSEESAGDEDTRPAADAPLDNAPSSSSPPSVSKASSTDTMEEEAANRATNSFSSSVEDSQNNLANNNRLAASVATQQK